MIKSASGELGIADRFVAGSMAGVFSQTAIYPLEVHYLLLLSVYLLSWEKFVSIVLHLNTH